MKRMGFLAAGLFIVASSAAQSAEIKWAKSLSAALNAARAGNRLVMADFYTDW